MTKASFLASIIVVTAVTGCSQSPARTDYEKEVQCMAKIARIALTAKLAGDSSIYQEGLEILPPLKRSSVSLGRTLGKNPLEVEADVKAANEGSILRGHSEIDLRNAEDGCASVIDH